MNEKAVRRALPETADLVTLHLRSPGASLAAHLPAPSTALVGVASTWPAFLKTARTMLVAAGFPSECLVLRVVVAPTFNNGRTVADVLRRLAALGLPVIAVNDGSTDQTSAILDLLRGDSLTANQLDGTPRVLVFSLLSESSRQELKRYEDFIRQPFTP